jgi:hypothetical protein
MDNYNCKCCNYTTIKKQTYERHLLSVKHLKKENNLGNKRENHADMNVRLLEYIKASEASRETELLQKRKVDSDLIDELRQTIKDYAIRCRTHAEMDRQKDDRITFLTEKLKKCNVIV